MSLWTTVTPEVPPSIARTTACPWVRVHDLGTRTYSVGTVCTRTRTFESTFVLSKVLSYESTRTTICHTFVLSKVVPSFIFSYFRTKVHVLRKYFRK
ncbi:uncharacterized protein MICPUCDRAFT_55258 [Micromonas pusilla CCMP1545]|uniref:Predicted protein n=1 Tax=Micromonas pusilla (strain CCMP1545) TaxID=564608 RepID=C1MKA6_MICPC|nr:uncharacterized protein MICPUCDRAFT_55258 [Micromonas pusilla CCMP1545]EEH59729.1 predicted protein [Micromonas pusilla CCMP1545]|eukprot:XP_003056353.1 predicted protein [Micromonas pusilla CCMP1545]